jgi:hypothetical protein
MRPSHFRTNSGSLGTPLPFSSIYTSQIRKESHNDSIPVQDLKYGLDFLKQNPSRITEMRQMSTDDFINKYSTPIKPSGNTDFGMFNGEKDYYTPKPLERKTHNPTIQGNDFDGLRVEHNGWISKRAASTFPERFSVRPQLNDGSYSFNPYRTSERTGLTSSGADLDIWESPARDNLLRDKNNYSESPVYPSPLYDYSIKSQKSDETNLFSQEKKKEFFSSRSIWKSEV